MATEKMKLAFVFALIGFGTKAGFAPLHTWLPDAHSQAPSPVSAVLSGVLLKCGLYAVLRFHAISIGAVGPEFSSNLLLWFGMISVVVAVPFILVQRDLKRLLAYSRVQLPADPPVASALAKTSAPVNMARPSTSPFPGLFPATEHP